VAFHTINFVDAFLGKWPFQAGSRHAAGRVKEAITPVAGVPVDQTKTQTLTVDQRRAIFRTLLDAQDSGASVAESREAVSGQFGVSEDQVKQIEVEGMDNEWPPL
jgi:hypothetical protein